MVRRNPKRNNLTKGKSMSYYKKQHEPISKEKKVLNQICKECGRTRRIPMSFCNDCWREMNQTINKSDKQ